MVVGLPVLVLHSVAGTQMYQIDDPRIEIRHFGDAQRALARIHESAITTVDHLNELANDPDVSPLDRLVFAHAPLMLATPEMFSGGNDTPLGLFYTLSVNEVGETRAVSIRYYLYFPGEDEGTPLLERMARYGHPFDGELPFEVNFIDDRILSAYYQAPIHRTVRFPYDGSQRPVFAIASGNHNFRLVQRDEGPLVAYLPQNEFSANPFHDPDFVALAAHNARVLEQVDISQYVYVAFQNPLSPVPLDVSVRVRGEWYHLHDVLPDGLPGMSLTVQGYHQVGIRLPFTPRPEDIDEVRIVIGTRKPVQVAIFALYVYPQPLVAT